MEKKLGPVFIGSRIRKKNWTHVYFEVEDIGNVFYFGNIYDYTGILVSGFHRNLSPRKFIGYEINDNWEFFVATSDIIDNL